MIPFAVRAARLGLTRSFTINRHFAAISAFAFANIIRMSSEHASSSAAAISSNSSAAAEPQYAQLDRYAFDRPITLVAIKVRKEKVEPLQRALHKQLLRMPSSAGLRPVIKDPEDDAYRLVLLADGTTPTDLSGLTVQQRQAISDASGEVISHGITLGYDHMTVDEVLRAVIPSGLAGQHDLPTSFETAGHVAHLNLRDEYLKWKYVIAQVILDKHPHLRTVLNKTGAIHETFRTFPCELLAGEDDTQVEVRHCGATFRFDFRRVYWNSRLAYEHEHVVKKVIPRGAIVADMFCGVGPFAIPLALPPQACTVHANDLNPASHAALADNIKRNKGTGGRIVCYNMDGRAFIRRLVASRVPFAHVLMNLPADAISFLDVFRGLYREGPEEGGSSSSSSSSSSSASSSSSSSLPVSSLPLPKIHVYCFVKLAESLEDAQRKAASRLLKVLTPQAQQPAEGTQAALDAALALLPDLTARHIRDVSPRKMMLCLSFTLPRSVATAEEEGVSSNADAREDAAAEPAAKRAKVDTGEGSE